MSKEKLVETIAAETGASKAAVTKILNATLGAITKSLKKGDPVTLVGFGTFKVVKRNARNGRNPQTGAPLKIAARKAALFTPGKGLKETINQ